MSLPELTDTETIGRSVFSSSRAKRGRRGIVVPDIFLEKPAADSISMDRMDHASPTDLATLSKETGRSRTPQQDFYGWATLEVREAASSGRSVRATPKEDNVYHVDIFLNLPDDDERRDRQKQHATALAAVSKWLDAP